MEKGNDKIFYQMSQSQLFYETAVRPYIEPLSALTHHTMGKLITGIFYVGFMVATFAAELFATPHIWWQGLAVLVMLDFLAGNFRAIADPEIDFCIGRWGRTAYKIPSYIIACLAVSAGANMFPSSLGWLQYVTYAVLAGTEIWSILRHLKMFALMAVLSEVAANKYSISDDFKKRVDDKAREQFKEHEESVYGRD